MFSYQGWAKLRKLCSKLGDDLGTDQILDRLLRGGVGVGINLKLRRLKV
jgi:hypothetical protein